MRQNFVFKKESQFSYSLRIKNIRRQVITVIKPKNIKVPFNVKSCAIVPNKAGPKSNAVYPETEIKLTAETIGILFCLAAVERLNGVIFDMPSPIQQKPINIMIKFGKRTTIKSPTEHITAP